MEPSGHLEGMLDRDQRTAKLRFFDNSDGEVVSTRRCGGLQDSTKEAASPASRPCCHPGRTRRGASTSSCRIRHLLNTVQSVKGFLAVVCLITATLPSVLSAPVSMDLPEKWVNPCDAIEKKSSDENLTPTVIAQTEFQKVKQQAQTAQKLASDTLNAYVTEILKDSDTAAQLDTQPISWLPDMSSDSIDNSEVDKILADTYSYLQKVAVGLDLVVRTWPQNEQVEFKAKFTDAENQLRIVLCELWHIIVESNRTLPEDVHRTIVTEAEEKILTKVERKTRDYMILKKYANSLEYVIQVFSVLSENNGR